MALTGSSARTASGSTRRSSRTGPAAPQDHADAQPAGQGALRDRRPPLVRPLGQGGARTSRGRDHGPEGRRPLVTEFPGSRSAGRRRRPSASRTASPTVTALERHRARWRCCVRPRTWRCSSGSRTATPASGPNLLVHRPARFFKDLPPLDESVSVPLRLACRLLRCRRLRRRRRHRHPQLGRAREPRVRARRLHPARHRHLRHHHADAGRFRRTRAVGAPPRPLRQRGPAGRTSSCSPSTASGSSPRSKAFARRGWVVRAVEPTDRVEEVFCAEVADGARLHARGQHPHRQLLRLPGRRRRHRLPDEDRRARVRRGRRAAGRQVRRPAAPRGRRRSRRAAAGTGSAAG